MTVSGLPLRLNVSTKAIDLPVLFLVVSGCIWVVPAVQILLKTAWQTDAGSIGPLTLLLGLAVLRREILQRDPPFRPAPVLPCLAVLGLASVLYTVAVILTFAALAVFAAWLGLIAVLLALYGAGELRRCWFPLAYLLLVLPLPYSLSYGAAARLGGWLGLGAVRLLRPLGLEVAVKGSTVYIDQYELVVEQACAGLSSTLSLIAIGVIYARWVHRARPVRLLVLVLAALPVALLANQLRVAALVGAVHWRGSAVLSTALHPLSGLVSFGLALALIALVDQMLGRMVRRPNGHGDDRDNELPPSVPA